MKRSHRPLLFALLGLIAAAQLGAQNIAWTEIDQTIVDFAAAAGNDGLKFTVGAQNIQVTALGYFDYQLNGLASAHDLAIYTLGGTTLASTTLPALSEHINGDFRFSSITPLTLQAGTSYMLVGYDIGQGVDPVNKSGVGAVGPGITFNGYYYNYNSFGFVDPASAAQYSPAYLGPNFEYTVIPEPSTYALLAGCLVFGFILVRHRPGRTEPVALL